METWLPIYRLRLEITQAAKLSLGYCCWKPWKDDKSFQGFTHKKKKNLIIRLPGPGLVRGKSSLAITKQKRNIYNQYKGRKMPCLCWRKEWRVQRVQLMLCTSINSFLGDKPNDIQYRILTGQVKKCVG